MTNRLHKSKQISSLINSVDSGVKCAFGNVNQEIGSVEYDSRKVNDNSLFVAVPGFVADGHSFIGSAVEKGAKAVLVSEERLNEFTYLKEKNVTVLSAQNTRKALSSISAAFYGYPTSGVPVIGVTGTNGKTSITYLIESVLKKNDFTPGVIGTVNYRWNTKTIEAPNTTPESKDLQELFANMISDGVDAIIMEVSSHALKLFRVEDVEFDIVLFTNLTRDHLDFHESFEDYYQSKKRIFHLLQKSRKSSKGAIINIDDDYGKEIFSKKDEYNFPVSALGIRNDADFKIKRDTIKSTSDGTSYILEKPISDFKISLNILGNFQAYNSLFAFAASYMMGVPANVIKQGLSELKAVPGRFDSIKSMTGFNVIVDYAHTDDAVSKLLTSVKDLDPKRIFTVIGCGGNRDRTKRPLMGKTAVLNSDHVIFTSDNPRDEDPQEIINDIIAGLKEKNYEVIVDREQAIKKAVNMAEKSDMVVIAGKGHEDYQIIKGKKSHFDDHEIAKKYIIEREAN